MELQDENDDQIIRNQEEIEKESVTTISLSGLYENWFLDYASYVILERAVPNILDGFKPVHRRILHSMREMDDGRFNKVANIIGHTMKYHPHGDASIGDALVQIGQKELLVETQGNWGNTLTGDSAAAPRYIEARLSKFAQEVVFNPKTTNWQSSYDGRNKEPITLPVKFPLLLAQGVEGIAVGLASKIFSHNFIELIDAAVSYLKGQNFVLYPDFYTAGTMDVSKYNNGLRGGRLRVRAKITKPDKKTLVITEIPFSQTTTSVIESIVKQNDKGKIKIKKIEDNTAENVEIVIQLAPNISPDQTIDALYAFTACEVSLNPNSCVIYDHTPVFYGVEDLLKVSVDNTVKLLKLELEIRRDELMEQWHFSSLEKIFIRERIYRDIEEAENWEMALDLIDKGLDPYKHLFKREITRDDISKLTEIRIKRISKYNEFKADEFLRSLEEQLKEVEFHLNNLIQYAIDYFLDIKKRFGAGRERKTELRSFEIIDAASVAVSNVKLYVNRAEGFMGTGLKKDEFITECSDIDDIIVFRENGTFVVTKVADKAFVGKNIIHIDVLKKNDDRTTYNVVYRDGLNGKNYVKRFAVVGFTRDKEYDITRGKVDSKILYLTSNPNGEAEIIKVKLRPRPSLRKISFDFDFSTLAIKGRAANGNTMTKYPISKISLKEDGVSTLGAMDIWYDDTVRRLNADGRGKHLGAFSTTDKILTIMSSGFYMLNGFDLTTHFDEDMVQIIKYDEDSLWTAVYLDGESDKYYIKRFRIELSDKKVNFLSEHPKSKLHTITDELFPRFNLKLLPDAKGKKREDEMVEAEGFIDEKSVKAKGKRISNFDIKTIVMLEPLPVEEDEDVDLDDNEVDTNDGFTEEELNARNTVVKAVVVEDIEDELDDENTPEEEFFEKPTHKKAKVSKTNLIQKVEIIEEEVVGFEEEETEDSVELENEVEIHAPEPVVEVIMTITKPKTVIKSHSKLEKSKSSEEQNDDEFIEKKSDEPEIQLVEKKLEVVIIEQLPLDIIDEKVQEEKKPKEKAPAKAKAKKTDTKIIRTSLDGDEPLQFELSFD